MRFLAILCYLTFVSFSSTTVESKNQLDFLESYISVRYPEHDFGNYVFVEVKKQKMHIIRGHQIVKTYAVSTAKNGIGNVRHSECTPAGLLTVKYKIGDNAPVGGILVGKYYTGRKAEIYTDKSHAPKDHVTTRALRLAGLEHGKNKGGNIDTYARHIYIHGTPEEGFLGEPVSHGCIRMRNTDIIEFYNLIETNTKVLILNL